MFKSYKEVRLGIYLLGIAAQVASFFVSITAPEFGQALVQTADVLTVFALSTALTNLSDSDVEGSGFDVDG